MVSEKQLRPTRRAFFLFFGILSLILVVFLFFAFLLSNTLANVLARQRIDEIASLVERHTTYQDSLLEESSSELLASDRQDFFSDTAAEILHYPGIEDVSFIDANGVLLWTSLETIIIEDFVTETEYSVPADQVIGHLYRAHTIASMNQEDPVYVEPEERDFLSSDRTALVYIPASLPSVSKLIFVEVVFDETSIFQEIAFLRNVIVVVVSVLLVLLTAILFFLFRRLYRKVIDQSEEIDSYIEQLQKTVGKTSKELSATQEQLEKIVAAAQDVIVIIDRKLKIVFINEAVEKILGYSKEDVLGQSIKKFMKVEGLFVKGVGSVAMRIFGKTGKGPLVGKTIEATLYHKNGEEVLTEFTTSALKVKGKWQALAVIRDITERRQAEEEKRAALERAERYFNLAPILMIVINKNGTVLDVNEAGAKILGYEKDEIVGRNWFEHFVKAEDKTTLKQLHADNLEKEVVFSEYENEIIDAQGEERSMRWRNTVLSDEEEGVIAVLSSGIDVTDRKKQQRALVQSEQRLRDIVLNSQDVVWELNAKGEVTFVEGAVEKMSGYTPEEMIGKKAIDMIDKEKSEAAVKSLASIIQRKDHIVDLVNWNRKKDGSSVCVATNGVPIYNEEGEFIGYRGVHKDITERIRTQEALMASEEEYQRLYNNAPAMFVSVDPESKAITQVNDVFLQKTGFDRDEVIGKSAYTFLATDDVERAKEVGHSLEHGKTVTNEEFALKKKDGGFIYTQLNATPDLNSEGKNTESQLVLTDITEIKKAREEQEKAARISEVNPAAVMELGLDGIIQYMNPAAEKIQAAGLEIKQENKKVNETIWNAIKDEMSKKARQLELAVGSYYFNILTVKDGDRIILFMRDRTEQEKLESEVSELDKLKSRFITALTHVARTPLSEVRWALESLVTGEFGSVNESQATMINRALESENEVLQIIDNMNLVLDIERDTMRIEPTMTSIEGVIRSVVSSGASECEIKNITCNVPKPSSKIPDIFVDPEKIRTMLQLVFDNGIRYSNAGGSVKIKISKTTKSIIIKVVDQGVGIPKDELENIKNRFFRASNAQSVHPSGIGLGLYIANAIAMKHGGSLDIKSEEGKGTEVTIKLPIKKG